MKPILFFVCMGMVVSTSAQHINAHVREANGLYKQKKYEEALREYQQGVSAGASDEITRFNLGNALFRTSHFEDAAKSFASTANQAEDLALKQQAMYNEGVSYSKQQKLEESIRAYKQAVILNPADEDARVNLQKALMEQKKKQPPQQQKNEEKKEQKKQQQQKQPPKSNLTKKQVEQLLKALQQREQQVQQKMQQNRQRTAGQQEKDW